MVAPTVPRPAPTSTPHKTSEPAENNGPLTNGAAKSAPPPQPPAVLAPSVTGSENELLVSPPTAEFQQDLLNAVSERTGYPLDMLKEDALLEADLGIDSIKTVEIFGSLTRYHKFMPGSEGFDEELLSEFAKLKTLGDIVAMYDRGRTGVSLARDFKFGPLRRRRMQRGRRPAETIRARRRAVRQQRLPLPKCRPMTGPLKLRCRGWNLRRLQRAGGIRSRKKKFPSHDLVVILGDASSSLPNLAELLAGQGMCVLQLIPGKNLHSIDDRRLEVDFSTRDSLRGAVVIPFAAQLNWPVGAIVNLLGLQKPFSDTDLADALEPLSLAHWFLHTIQEFAEDLRASTKRAAAGF